MKLLKQEVGEKSTVKIEFSVDKEVFDKAVEKVYRRQVKKINVPGFRAGKAPRAIIEKMYGSGVFYEDAINDLIPENYTEADKLGANGCHRMYYTTTKDFVEFAPRKPFYDPGFNSIDGFVLQKGEGEYIAIVKDNRKPGYSDLFAASATDAEGPYGQPSEKFAPTYSEGACAVKVGEDWLIYFDVYRQYRFGAVRTRDFQTFEPIDSLISLPAGHKHGTIVKVKESVLEALKAEEARRYGAQE